MEINGDHYGTIQYVTRLTHDYDGSNCGSYANLRGCIENLNADNVLDVSITRVLKPASLLRKPANFVITIHCLINVPSLINVPFA